MKKKIQRGQKLIFLLKNTKFFQKLIFFLEKLVNQGGGAKAPPAPLGTPLKNSTRVSPLLYQNATNLSHICVFIKRVTYGNYMSSPSRRKRIIATVVLGTLKCC